MFQKVIKSAQLISLPDIYIKLKHLIDGSDYSMAQVAVLVSSDPGMATRFLRLVNSSLNRRVHEIETISHAVSLLGIQQIHDIVLSASISKAFEGILEQKMDMKKFWQKSFYSAVMAKQLAMECGVFESERIFTIGLLHDIGHMIMYQAIPDESLQAVQKSKETSRPLYQVERELIGFDYAKLGGYLMKQWKLPKSFQMITFFHPEPHKTNQFSLEAALLHLGYLLVLSDLEDGVFGEGAYIVDSSVWSTTSLTMENCLEYRQTALDQFNKVKNNLF
ncbi:MAG: HDOD domain-containing protein [Desulfobacteraceae bacterium]|nr:HDOD domain-containing protein [Desulfobacteraceae bacterium]